MSIICKVKAETVVLTPSGRKFFLWPAPRFTSIDPECYVELRLSDVNADPGVVPQLELGGYYEIEIRRVG